MKYKLLLFLSVTLASFLRPPTPTFGWTEELMQARCVSFVGNPETEANKVYVATVNGERSTYYRMKFNPNCLKGDAEDAINNSYNDMTREVYGDLVVHRPNYSKFPTMKGNRGRTRSRFEIRLNTTACGQNSDGHPIGTWCEENKNFWWGGRVDGGEYRYIGYSNTGTAIENPAYPVDIICKGSTYDSCLPKGYPWRPTAWDSGNIDKTDYDSASTGSDLYKIKYETVKRFLAQEGMGSDVNYYFNRFSLKNDGEMEAGILAGSSGGNRYNIVVAAAPKTASRNMKLVSVRIVGAPQYVKGNTQYTVEVEVKNEGNLAVNRDHVIKLSYGSTNTSFSWKGSIGAYSSVKLTTTITTPNSTGNMTIKASLGTNYTSYNQWTSDDSASWTTYVDVAAPTNSVSLSRDNAWGNTNVTATLYAGDSGSGLASQQYAMWDNNTNTVVKGWTNYSNNEQTTVSREGVTRIQTWSKDKAGNETYGTSKYIKIDKTNPTGSISVNTENWQNTNSVTATLYAGDGLSGVKSAQYRLTGATSTGWIEYSNGKQLTISNEGTTKIEIWVQDHAGNAVYADTKHVRIDRTNPTGSISVNESWQSVSSVTATLYAGDATSGVRAAQYRLSGATTKDWTNYSNGNTITISNEGTTKIEIWVQDHTGNAVYADTKHVRIDRGKPSTSISLSRDNTWGNTDVTATLYGSDAVSGVASQQYAMWDNNTTTVVRDWTNFSNNQQLTISREGITRIQSWAKDYANNEIYGTSKYIKIDKTNPTGSISVNTENWQNTGSVTATLYAGDALSGVKAAQYRLSGATTKDWTNYSNGQQITISNEGTTKIEIWVQDQAGNALYPDTKYVRLDRTNPTGGITVNTENWQNVASVTATLHAGDSLSGIRSAQYRLTGATTKDWTNYSNGNTITISNQGETTIEIKVIDHVGLTYTLSKKVRLDRTNPTGGIAVNHENWQNATSVKATLTVGDSLSGVKSALYQLTGATAQGWTNYSNNQQITISNQGETTITIKITDNVGLTYTTSKTVRLDRNAPTLSTTQNPASWTNQNVTITAKATDNLALWNINAYDSVIQGNRILSSSHIRATSKVLFVVHDRTSENSTFTRALNEAVDQLKTMGISVTTLTDSNFTALSQASGYQAIFYFGWVWGPSSTAVSLINQAYNNGIAIFTSGNDCGSGLSIIASATQITSGYTIQKTTSANYLAEAVHATARDDSYYKITPAWSDTKILANVTHKSGDAATAGLMHHTNANSTQWIHLQAANEALSKEFVTSVALLLTQRQATLTTSLSHSFTVTENGSYPVTAYDLAGNRTTVTHVVNTIDRINPTGSVVIEDGKDFVNNEEVKLHLTFEDILSGNNAVSGVHTVRVFDVRGTYSKTFTNPSGTSMSIPWVLVPWEAPDGALKAQVGVEITDRAGNSITVYSQVVDIIKVYVTKFQLLNVLNPTVYNKNHPFTVLTYPNIPAQPLLSGAHFTYYFEYYHPKNVNRQWKIDYISNVRYQKPNGREEVLPIREFRQLVTGRYQFQHIIPYDLPVGTRVYLDLQLVLYDASGRKVAEGYFPQPMNTSLYLGEIEGDIRTTLQFNEVH